MTTYYIRLITSAISAGININSFCVKHNAKRGALRSMIFKLWQRCKLLAVKNTVSIKQSKIGNCVEIVSNTTNVVVLKTGSILAMAHIEAFQRVYKFNIVVV